MNRPMLARLGKTMRWKAAFALAVLYALCILTPSLAFAFGGAEAHCLTDAGRAHVHQRVAEAAKMHAHDDGTVHAHAAHATQAAHKHADEGVPNDHANGDGKASANCCGLFCVSAIAQDAPDFATTRVVSAQTVSALADVLTGCGPDRINRPPIR